MQNIKAFVFLCFWGMSLLFAGSIWQEDDVSVYGSALAHKLGDIILVKIDESSTATQKAQTDLKKNSQLQGDATFSWSQVASALNQNSNSQGKTGISAQNNFNGAGSTGRSSRLQAQLTASIYKVEQNKFFIRGNKKIYINNEEEEISIEGVVRPEDIQSDNSINSSMISDAVLKIKGYGAVANDQDKGFLGKLFDWLF